MSSRHNGYALRENIVGDLVAGNLNAQIIFAVADNINIGNIILLTWRRNFAGFQINDSKGNGTGEGAELFQPATFDTCFQVAVSHGYVGFLMKDMKELAPDLKASCS